MQTIDALPSGPRTYLVHTVGRGLEGTYDSVAEVAACLAFAKLSLDQVEVIADINPLARMSGWT